MSAKEKKANPLPYIVAGLLIVWVPRVFGALNDTGSAIFFVILAVAFSVYVFRDGGRKSESTNSGDQSHSATTKSDLSQQSECEPLEVREKVLYVYGDPVESHSIIEEIGRGASGVVYRAHHLMLEREEALKVWLKLRDRDERDKQIQGIREAQKLAKVSSEYAVTIYDARRLNRALIATMEFVPSVTLKDYIRSRNSVQQVLGAAYAYLSLIEQTTTPETLHGDPHWQNVLVYQDRTDRYNVCDRFKLCDFGTSAFSKDGGSDIRHWKTVWLTIVKMTKRLPNSSEARKAVEHLREMCIRQFKQMDEAPPGRFTALDKARMLTAWIRDYLDWWDPQFRSTEPVPLVGCVKPQIRE